MTPQKEISCHIFNMAFFQKFFADLMSHIIREYAGMKIKWFLNVSPLTIMNKLLWPFMLLSLYILTFMLYKLGIQWRVLHKLRRLEIGDLFPSNPLVVFYNINGAYSVCCLWGPQPLPPKIRRSFWLALSVMVEIWSVGG